MPVSDSPKTRRTSLVARTSLSRGFSLPELMITVTVTGILATLATQSFRQQIGKARSAEAVSMIGDIQRGVVVASSVDATTNSELTTGQTINFGNGNGKGSGNGNSGNSGSSSSSGSSTTGSSTSGSASSGSNGNSDKVDTDHDNGHGNSGGCDPSNPGKSGKSSCDEETSTDDSSSGNGNSGNGNSGNGNSGNGNSGNGNSGSDSSGNGNGNSGDGDHDNGHGNSGGCDPSNPGNSGSGQCDGEDSGGSDDDDAGSDTGSDSDSSGSGSNPGSSGFYAGRVCRSAVPVPASIESVRGQVYSSGTAEWSGNATSGWECLNVRRPGAQRFQFGYDSTESEPGSSTFSAWARGDQDGDGRVSLFSLEGSSSGGVLRIAPTIEIVDEGE